ncbi:hypothetical protein [Fodinicola feengrottensis]|uniref:hypothetical protein n=1 Tax=Fodinicola feengrottensis TaxID=435914 RepID=UPI0024416C2A|nr:hypothetical protein [Fodinicola feengrottensis]
MNDVGGIVVGAASRVRDWVRTPSSGSTPPSGGTNGSDRTDRDDSGGPDSPN